MQKPISYTDIFTFVLYQPVAVLEDSSSLREIEKDLMENNIKEIINYVQRLGIVESYYHYETDTITIQHVIATDKQAFSLFETDCKYTLTLILPEKHNNKYFRYKK